MGSEVLFVYPHMSSFIEQDLRLLEERFDVSTFHYSHRFDRFRLLRELRRTEVAVAWFVLGFAYEIVRLRTLHHAKSLLIAGGWDLEALDELSYGEMRSPKRSKRTAFALRDADRVFAVSGYTLGKVRQWAPSSKASILFHGFDDRIFVPGSAMKKGVLTVSTIAPETWRLKGLFVFVEAARRLPDVPFVLVGDASAASDLLGDPPPNLRITGQLTRERLIREYQGARVYAQLSAVESFGCALAEAMLCECVPVVTDRGALPEVVGSVGEKTPYGDTDRTIEAIDRGLDSSCGATARERIRSHFSLRVRAKQLQTSIDSLLGGQ